MCKFSKNTIFIEKSIRIKRFIDISDEYYFTCFLKKNEDIIFRQVDLCLP